MDNDKSDPFYSQCEQRLTAAYKLLGNKRLFKHDRREGIYHVEGLTLNASAEYMLMVTYFHEGEPLVHFTRPLDQFLSHFTPAVHP